MRSRYTTFLLIFTYLVSLQASAYGAVICANHSSESKDSHDHESAVHLDHHLVDVDHHDDEHESHGQDRKFVDLHLIQTVKKAPAYKQVEIPTFRVVENFREDCFLPPLFHVTTSDPSGSKKYKTIDFIKTVVLLI